MKFVNISLINRESKILLSQRPRRKKICFSHIKGREEMEGIPQYHRWDLSAGLTMASLRGILKGQKFSEDDYRAHLREKCL